MPLTKRKSKESSKKDDDNTLLVEVTQERLRALKESKLLLSHDLTADCLPNLLDSEMKKKLSVFVSCVAKKFGEAQAGSLKRVKKEFKRMKAVQQVEFSDDQRKIVMETIRDEIQKYDVPSKSDQIDHRNGRKTNHGDSDTASQDPQENGDSIEGDEFNNDHIDDNVSDDADIWWTIVKEKLPLTVLDRYREICFANFSKKWYPAIELGPQDVGGEIRKQWFKMLDVAGDDPKEVEKIRLVYWYGEERGSKDAYSFLAPVNIVSYDEGLKKGLNKDKKIESKLKSGKKLTKAETEWQRRLDQQQEEVERAKQDRIAWMELDNKPLDEILIVRSDDEDKYGEVALKKGSKVKKKKTIKSENLRQDVHALDDEMDIFSDDGGDDDFDIDEECVDEEEDVDNERHSEKPKEQKKESKIPKKVSKSSSKRKSSNENIKKKMKKKDFQIILEENEAVFIPLMLLLETAVESQNEKLALKSLERILVELEQMSVTFVESYTPSKLITKARRTFKKYDIYSEINSISKTINIQIRDQYLKEKSNVPSNFKPTLGLGHEKCNFFRYRPDVNTVSKDTIATNPLESGSRDTATPGKSPIISILNGSTLKQADRVVSSDRKPRVVDRSRSKTASRGKNEGKRSLSLPRISSMTQLISRSTSPKASSGNISIKVSESSAIVPAVKKMALSLRGLIDSNSSVSRQGALRMSGVSQHPEKVIHHTKDFGSTPQSLPNWMTKETQISCPFENSTRMLAVDFLKEAIELSLQLGDARLKKQSIVFHLEASIHEWSKTAQGPSSKGCPCYWLKVHEIVSALVGKSRCCNQKLTYLSKNMLNGKFEKPQDIIELSKEELSRSFEENNN